MRALARLLVGAFLVSLSIGVVSTSAQATGTGTQGCTPGYWKNHTSSWQEADASQLVKKKYVDARANVADWTLLQALQGGGGKGADGAAVILARAAVAAWLNAANDDVGYPWRRYATGVDGRPPLVATVNAAFASGDRDTMLALATRLDDDNNGTGCPLN
jgi:hypothetical protein